MQASGLHVSTLHSLRLRPADPSGMGSSLLVGTAPCGGWSREDRGARLGSRDLKACATIWRGLFRALKTNTSP